jgi:hypothetical protein
MSGRRPRLPGRTAVGLVEFGQQIGHGQLRPGEQEFGRESQRERHERAAVRQPGQLVRRRSTGHVLQQRDGVGNGQRGQLQPGRAVTRDESAQRVTAGHHREAAGTGGQQLTHHR